MTALIGVIICEWAMPEYKMQLDVQNKMVCWEAVNETETYVERT
jgi:hypothetical protein